MITPVYHGDAFWAMCSRVAQRAARRYAPAQEAPNIAQEALCHYYRALDRGRSVGDNEAYLRRIVARCAIDHWRARRRDPIPVELREGDTLMRAGALATSRQGGHDADQRLDLETLLTQLSPRERDAVRAVRAGESVELLAQAQGVSVRSVQRRVQRAICRMRAIVREADDSDSLGA